MQTDYSNIPNKLELHYRFTDDDHTMDAIIRNSCERELLAIVNEIASLLEVDITIETEASRNGGPNELWTLVSENRYVTGVIIGILINVLSRCLTTDRELSDLPKQELKLKIEKLKKGLKESKDEKPNINPEDSITAFNGNNKIIKYKSNFYQSLNEYAKVTQVTTVLLSHENQPIIDPTVIEREDFDKFILRTDELPSVLDENATIEIISPVLNKGKYSWKGVYKGEVIPFSLRDNEFKDHVINRDIQFKNGTCIDCVLEISRKKSNLGEIQNSGYTVMTVLRKHDEGTTTETPQGKRYRIKNEMETKQLKLF
jgi:hypothetical protein